MRTNVGFVRRTECALWPRRHVKSDASVGVRGGLDNVLPRHKHLHVPYGGKVTGMLLTLISVES